MTSTEEHYLILHLKSKHDSAFIQTKLLKDTLQNYGVKGTIDVKETYQAKKIKDANVEPTVTNKADNVIVKDPKEEPKTNQQPINNKPDEKNAVPKEEAENKKVEEQKSNPPVESKKVESKPVESKPIESQPVVTQPEPETHKPHIYKNQPQELNLVKHNDLPESQSHNLNSNTHNNTHHKLENMGDFMDDSQTFKHAKQSVKDMFPTNYENEYDTEVHSKFRPNDGDDKEYTDYHPEEQELGLHLPKEDDAEQRELDPEPMDEPVDEEVERKEEQMVEKQTKNETDGSPDKKSKMNLEDVDAIGLKILVDLTKFITSNRDTNIFEEYVFAQTIQVKGEQKEVFIMNAQDFFETLEMYGIISNPINKLHKAQLESAKEELKSLLCLDKKYKHLMMLKKINRAINQINENEDLYAQAKKAKYDDNESDHDQVEKASNNEQYDDEFMENDDNVQDDNPPSDRDEGDQNLDEDVQDEEIPENDDYIEDSFEKDNRDQYDRSDNKSPYANQIDEADENIYSDEFGPKSNEKSSSNAMYGNVRDFSDLNKDDEYNASSNHDNVKSNPKSKHIKDDNDGKFYL